MHKLAGIELGGTKTVVVLGQPGRIDERLEFATTGPTETLDRAIDAIRSWRDDKPVDAVGIASFGPLRVSHEASDHGFMLDTPKPGWSGAAVAGPVAAALGCPVGLDTDVNGAALAEHRFGAARGCESMVYLTIGTGLGGGVLIAGEPAHGLLHPEIGHVRLRRAPGDTFEGACAFHGDCMEGLVSGPALAARLGTHPSRVAADDPAWETAAHDLAELFAMLILTVSPQRIVVGGGVAGKQPHLLPMAIARVPALLGGYLRDCTREKLAGMITPPLLGDDAGPMGALILAARALEDRRAPARALAGA
ncbi:fructokinase [Novosphingobium barchaimii LL02]|uniref:fructokinase n=1 Tax=Novosphingobium barchaimii LL02 TaxID=1114963 RepID=A0A0J7XT68_9SPHN|nr:ROK family protein [Novosphingobium barchaimii]KMS55011.1 fructokinase [Novosphingobium barchaimii LL02]